MNFLKHSLSLILLFSTNLLTAQVDLTKYVNPFIGTGGHGHTFPGATLPFGMVQLSPDTRIDGSWDGCSGYHYSDSVLYGFSHTHLSGTGVSDYGDILLLPLNNEPALDESTPKALFSHNNEIATAGYYAVTLLNDSINAELTATLRTGMHRYSFNKTGLVYIYLDLNHRDKLTASNINIINDSTIKVYRKSEGWAKEQILYANIRFSKPFIQSKQLGNKKAVFVFSISEKESIMAKVALSAVDDDGAERNMILENPDWNFEHIKLAAANKWNEELSKIKVSSTDKNKLTVFYTAMYHCMIHPNIYNDVDGRYRGRDLIIHQTDHNYYTVFSLWDTFRAWHPLMTIIDADRVTDFIRTFLLQYEQGGLLPVWELAANETECMIGYHAVSVIADAMMKGIKGFDYEKAFEACKFSAEQRNRFGLGAYIDKGFLEAEDEHESVSKTLEYAYDDWCIAQMAKLLGKEDDYNTYMQRSQSWKNLFDPVTGFIRPRSNGGWLNPFDPFEVNNNYTEANGWQYNFFVPQDIDGLITFNGGKEKFEKKLDQLFSVSTKTTGREQSDITGLIGQYAHGNEPSHHIAYLYNYIDKPGKAEKIINKVINDFYKNSPDGLIGNEDCGQMSAWYVMSAIGMYPVCPGSNQYSLTTPQFNKIEISTSGNKIFTIDTKNKTNKTNFLKVKKTKNIAYRDGLLFNHSRFSNDNFLILTADSIPSLLRKKDSADNLQYADTFYRVPVITGSTTVFKDSLMISIKSNQKDKSIIYLQQGPFERPAKIDYKKPFYIYDTSVIHAFVTDTTGIESKWAKAEFFKLPHPKWKVSIKGNYNPQYNAGGANGLIDGLHGDVNWRKGRWQGYQSQNFECVIDMGNQQEVSSFNTSFLQDTRAWILMPVSVEYFTSDDGKFFSSAGIVQHQYAPDNYEISIENFKLQTEAPIKARYIKVVAVNFGKLPSWHQGFTMGGEAFIFVDEVEVE